MKNTKKSTVKKMENFFKKQSKVWDHDFTQDYRFAEDERRLYIDGTLYELLHMYYGPSFRDAFDEMMEKNKIEYDFEMASVLIIVD